MTEKIDNKLFNLVLFELEKYCNNMTTHPLVSDDVHYAELRTRNAPLNRAIHWYLIDNGLIYQDRVLRLDVQMEDYAISWILKKFSKLEVCRKIIEVYEEYLSQFLKDFEELPIKINCGLENELIKSGKAKELNNIFESLNKKYYGNTEITISEYNKFLLLKYSEQIRN